MRKGLITALVLTLTLGLAAYSLAQQGPPRGPQGMGPGQMGPGMWGHMGPGTWEHMGPGMMGGWGGYRMMGPMMGSPEIMGTMMSIHGEIQSLMGQMMQKYGGAIAQMTPELQQKIQKELMERMGNILTKHGAALKQMAKAPGK